MALRSVGKVALAVALAFVGRLPRISSKCTRVMAVVPHFQSASRAQYLLHAAEAWRRIQYSTHRAPAKQQANALTGYVDASCTVLRCSTVLRLYCTLLYGGVLLSLLEIPPPPLLVSISLPTNAQYEGFYLPIPFGSGERGAGVELDGHSLACRAGGCGREDQVLQVLGRS